MTCLSWAASGSPISFSITRKDFRLRFAFVALKTRSAIASRLSQSSNSTCLLLSGSTLTERLSRMLEKHSKSQNRKRAMSSVIEAQELIRGLFPVSRYGKSEAAIWAAYRSLKLKTQRRARSIWYGESNSIEASEMDALRLEKARQEVRANAIRLHETASYLRHQDPDFHRDTITALECAASQIGVDDSA